MGEFSTGLSSEGAAVDQEEDAFGLGKFNEAVHKTDGCVGFAAARGHLDEGAGSGFLEGEVEVGDGFDLAVAEPVGDEGRKLLEACP